MKMKTMITVKVKMKKNDDVNLGGLPFWEALSYQHLHNLRKGQLILRSFLICLNISFQLDNLDPWGQADLIPNIGVSLLCKHSHLDLALLRVVTHQPVHLVVVLWSNFFARVWARLRKVTSSESSRSVSAFILWASCSHHEFHIVWKQTCRNHHLDWNISLYIIYI